MSNKVILGLSGGVDSAVAAKILQEQGYEVLGLYLDIGTPGGADEAKSAADSLKIPLTVKDITKALEREVTLPFAKAYLEGKTPNPCIICNPGVKFYSLMEAAQRENADFIATGHYARIERENGQARLLKGTADNDQSYMLCRITKAQLDKLLLPLGALSKDEIRQKAKDMGLSIWSKPDSMEICFIPDGDYPTFIEKYFPPPPPGDFVDSQGEKLGRHKGIHHYTLGQRRGLGISSSSRLFVTDIVPEENKVVLSSGDDLFYDRIKVSDISWLVPPSGGSVRASVKIRHSKNEAMAEIILDGQNGEIYFENPVRAPSPGQTAAFYHNDVLLGGGFMHN